jgi:hypothetical membrane protein
MKIPILKIAGCCGIISVFISIIAINTAIILSPSFRWTEHWLSDLAGVLKPPERPDPSNYITATIFNTGIIISSIFSMVFAIGLRKSIRPRIGRAGTFILLLGVIAFCCVGIFPEPVGILHIVSALAFFSLMPIAMFLIAAAAFKTKRNYLGWISASFAIVALICGVFLLPLRAIPEMIAAVAIALWTTVFSVLLFKVSPSPIIPADHSAVFEL